MPLNSIPAHKGRSTKAGSDLPPRELPAERHPKALISQPYGLKRSLTDPSVITAINEGIAAVLPCPPACVHLYFMRINGRDMTRQWA